MAKRGRNLTATEKKSLSRVTDGKVDPDNYLLQKTYPAGKGKKTVQLRDKTTGEEFEVTLDT